MNPRTPRDYDGSAPLICWPLYWSVMAARSTETRQGWWSVMAARVREWLKLS